MTRAGYCADCQSTVWLTEDGGCQNGHAASSVSGEYDVPSSGPVPAAPRKIWPFILAASIVLVVLGASACACVYAVSLSAPSQDEVASQAAAYEEELEERLSQDYPDWECVTFDREVVVTSDGPEMNCTFLLIPPGRDFSVGVYYDAFGDGPVVLHDDILRPGGRYHDRSESLLDYLESAYVKQGRSIVAVLTETSGDASVRWADGGGNETVSFEYWQTDLLVFDEDSGTWGRD